MNTITAIIILLLAVVVADVIHLQWPVVPLALYQLLTGIILTFLPLNFKPGQLVTEPELFMMLVIAPLLFNDGQKQSFRQLRHHSHVILSVAVGLAILTVLIAGSVLHLVNQGAFPFAIAFMLAAIITPTDAVAVKSITQGVKMPGPVKDSLDYESLFNDASGIVLFDLALATISSGSFSLVHGIEVFLYVFFGGLLFGAVFGSLIISLRRVLSAGHANIGSIINPLNIMTPLITFWLAEELGCSGILAVVAAGVVHSVFYDQLHLESARSQLTNASLWEIIEEALNGLVFVLLGAILPTVLSRTNPQTLGHITFIALILYLIMFALRYLWGRFGLTNLQAREQKSADRHSSLIFAVSGIHGTITMAMAFSIPVTIAGTRVAMRNTMILIAAMVILISLAVGTILLPLLLPGKELGYSKTEFSTEMTKAVQSAEVAIREANVPMAETNSVIVRLHSQITQYHPSNSRVFHRLLKACQWAEFATLAKITKTGQLSKAENLFFGQQLLHSMLFSGFNGWWNLFCFVLQHPRWTLLVIFKGHKVTHPSAKCTKRWSHQMMIAANRCIRKLQTDDNQFEIELVRRNYSRRIEATSRQGVDNDLLNRLFVDAFQAEHTYVQTNVANGKISQELANALNRQISIDELSYVQSAS